MPASGSDYTPMPPDQMNAEELMQLKDTIAIKSKAAFEAGRKAGLEEVLRLIERSYSMNPERDKPLFDLGAKICARLTQGTDRG
jgi:hypothetical protein